MATASLFSIDIPSTEGSQYFLAGRCGGAASLDRLRKV
jgi:hypothetical protein